jgi:hypothetical protein
MFKSIYRIKTPSVAFYGYIMVNDRYISTGEANPLFKIGKKKFQYNLIDSRNIIKTQPSNNMVFKVEENVIETKTQSDKFVPGNYLELGGKLFVILTSNQEPGVQRHIYRNFKVNSTAKYVMKVREAQE